MPRVALTSLPPPGQILLRHLQRHGAGYRYHFVAALVADEQVGGPGLEVIIVDEPADHVGRGEAERVIERGRELGLAADANQVFGILETRSAHARVLADVD